MNETERNEILADLRIYLGITWEDPDLDKKLTGLAERGISEINRAGGQEYDYTKEAAPRQLLFDYVRYGRDDALDQWEINFGRALRTLAADTAVSAES